MNDLREMLLAAFQVEHKEYLAGIRALLKRLERGAAPADLEEVFRMAHSLRAAARACDFRTVEAIGRRLETLFSQARKGTLNPGKELLEVVRAALNAIEDWALELAAGRNSPEPAQALEALDQVLAGKPTGTAKEAQPDELSLKLQAAFQVEHKEHLEGIRFFLAAVENGAGTAGGVDEAFRHAHSLKGAARIAEVRTVETLAHRLEALFVQVREQGLTLSPEVVRAINLTLDAIEDGAACAAEKRSSPAPTQALAALGRVLGPSADEPSPRADARRSPASASRTPVPANVDVAVAEEPSPRAGARRTPAAAATDSVRVSADNLDRLLRSTGQLLTEGQRQDLVARELSGLARRLEEMEKEWEAVRGTPALRQLATLPALDRVARYVSSVEQQVHALARQVRAVRRLHQQSSWALRLLGGHLQQDVRRVRMVPAESIFQGFRKMMRDLARDEGKELEFRAVGLEIEADRMVFQALKDPLMHMLCNAVSHGLEPTEERRSRGKDAVGRVTLRLEIVGNRLQMVIDDDGRGIDYHQVAQVAVQRGLLTSAGDATPEDLARFLFQPGFTTSRTVTDLSGRGMGLSVVHEVVTRLQGEIELRPKEEPGTCLCLTVPLSVSTQRLLLVSWGSQCFALPVHAVERLLRVRLDQVETVEGRPMLVLEGQPVPLLSLGYLLHVDEAGVRVQGDTLPLLVLRSGPRRVAVVVDAFLAERDSFIKDLDPPACQVPGLAGGILLEDGAVALVLNPAELIAGLRPSDPAPALRSVAPTPEKRQPTVLVVDDSLTTRTLEKSLLEAHGYRVRIAMDGAEALVQLRDELADLVITDIQMPRLDGFGLLAEMKKDERLARVPVIVVTSLDRREDQERGLALGADAYVVKRKFDHQELLETIRQIL